MRVPIIVFCLIALLAATLGAGLSRAGIDASHHDTRHYLPDKDACLTCHSRKDANSYAGMVEELGGVGGQCIFLCHSGKGILPETDTLVPKPGPSVSAEDYGVDLSADFTSVFFTRSHGRKPSRLLNGNGEPVPWPPARVTWPSVSSGANIECTSCHAVHDNRHPPFLVAPLGASYPDMDGLCDRCHGERATNNLTRPPDGNHPVDFYVDNLAAASRGERGRHPRRITIQKYGQADGSGTIGVFDVPNPAPEALNETTASWSMGGHLFSGANRPMTAWSGEGSIQQMGCYTCHSAHRTTVNGENNLVVVRTVSPNGDWNPLCVGCHGSAVSLVRDRTEWNVGVTPYGHPAGRSTLDIFGYYTSSTGGFRFRVSTPKHLNPGGGNQYGPRGELLCTTCHKVHFGAPASMAVANLGQGTKSICKSCHNGVGHSLESTEKEPPNSHHVTLTAEKFGQIMQGGANFQNPTWVDPARGLGDLALGMDCPDCHVYNGMAHNW